MNTAKLIFVLLGIYQTFKQNTSNIRISEETLA